MRKLITLTVAVILAILVVIPVVAEGERKNQLFENDLTVGEDYRLSVYKKWIRENINEEEWSECGCVGLHNCASLYHILKDTEEDDFYKAFFNDEHFFRPLGKVYVDSSFSMKETFCYEKSEIEKNLSPVMNEKEVENIFTNQETDLYGFLTSFDKEVLDKVTVIMPEETPIIITDLWSAENEYIQPFRYYGEIIFCVPYSSTNTEGILHCEEVVNDLLWNHSLMPGDVSIYVVYTDKVIVNYNNGIYNGDFGFIEIYIP